MSPDQSTLVAPLTPAPYRVVGRRTETGDVVTVALRSETGPTGGFRAGQFNMLTAFGVGEAAISISSTPGAEGPLEHTVRDVGRVSHALCVAPVGAVVGVRGPFGTDWGLDDLPAGVDHVVIVAGGIGLAPLRGAVNALARRRGHPRQVFLLIGARSPDQVVYATEIDSWRRAGIHVELSVDVGTRAWPGKVGVVTSLLDAAPFDPAQTLALVCGPEIMMRFAARALMDHGVGSDRIRVSLERNMQCGLGWCGHCQLGPLLLCREGPVVAYGGVASRVLSEARAMIDPRPHGSRQAADGRPTLAVWKFASCDGCQLTLLDCEEELLALAGAVRIVHFTELSRASFDGPYDLSLVEGSISTPEDAERIRRVRSVSHRLVTIGACATAGGIQGLRNFAAAGEYRSIVYARPEYINSLDTSTAISAHVPVDFELHGCPIDRGQLLEVLTAELAGRRPVIPCHSVCQECKGRGTVCLLVRGATPCLGPVTRAGCGALCPSLDRGCFGCFGPADTANTAALARRLSADGMSPADVSRLFSTFNAGAPAFQAAAGTRARPPSGNSGPGAQP